MRAGTLGGTLGRPMMELTYTVSIQRATSTLDSMGSKKMVYVPLPGIIPCDVAPMKDDLIFAQQGEAEKLTHVLHFFSGTDILPNDLVKVLSSKKLAGPIGQWIRIATLLEPSEIIGYIRCFGEGGTAPIA